MDSVLKYRAATGADADASTTEPLGNVCVIINPLALQRAEDVRDTPPASGKVVQIETV